MAKTRPKFDSPPLTESDIQAQQYWKLTRMGRVWISANVYIYDWESDLLSLTKAGMVTEYEIKVSKPDFKKDFEKSFKHQILETGERPLISERHWRWLKTEAPAQIPAMTRPAPRPNQFFYLCPSGLITEQEVPDYAGLAYVARDGKMAEIVKQAPKLHTTPISDTNMERLKVAFYYKYWRNYLKA